MQARDERIRRRRRPRRLRRRALVCVAAAALVVLVLVCVSLLMRPHRGLISVAGVEVTRQDLNAEARAQNLSPVGAAEPVLLEAVATRKLLAQEARRRGLDRRSDFPSLRARAVELTLAQALASTLPRPPTPSEAAVDAYIAAHPAEFGDRRRWVVDAITVSSSSAASLSNLSWTDIKPRLDAARIPYGDQPFVALTSELTPVLRMALEKSVPDAVVAVTDGGRTTLYHVAQSEPAPLVGEAAQVAARAELQSALRQAQLDALVQRLRRSSGGTP